MFEANQITEKVCPRCNGYGRYDVPVGRGYVQRMQIIRCPMCGGRGRIEHTEAAPAWPMPTP